MPVPNLPSEIIDHIVDFLHNDRPALAACSLVSFVFVPTSRHHLFSEVNLECSRLCVFLRLLDVPWSTIALAINRMIISERRSLRGRTPCKKAYYVPENPARLRSHLQGVKSIRFSNISLADIPPPFWRLLNDLHGVRNLEVHRMSFGSPDEFFRYICALPALEALSISKSSWDTSGPHDLHQFKPQAPFTIPLLDVGRHSQYGVMDWFLAQSPIPPVHTLRVNMNSGPATIEKIHHYIEAAGVYIQHLHIVLPAGIPDSNLLSAIDFTPCADVKTIHIEGLRISIQETPSRSLKEFMRTLFEQVGSQTLSGIYISMNMDLANDAFAFFGIPDHIVLQSFDWGGLPAVLEQTLGHRLKTLSVSIGNYPKFQHEWSEKFLRKGPFRFLNERDVLSIDFPNPLVDEEWT